MGWCAKLGVVARIPFFSYRYSTALHAVCDCAAGPYEGHSIAALWDRTALLEPLMTATVWVTKSGTCHTVRPSRAHRPASSTRAHTARILQGIRPRDLRQRPLTVRCYFCGVHSRSPRTDKSCGSAVTCRVCAHRRNSKPSCTTTTCYGRWGPDEVIHTQQGCCLPASKCVLHPEAHRTLTMREELSVHVSATGLAGNHMTRMDVCRVYAHTNVLH